MGRIEEARARIEALEAASQGRLAGRLIWAAALAALVAAALPPAASQARDKKERVITADRFFLRDAAGKIRGLISVGAAGPGIALFDREERRRSELFLGKGSGAALLFLTEKRQARMLLEAPPLSSRLMLLAPGGTLTGILSFTKEGGLTMRGEAGDSRALMIQDARGAELLLFDDARRKRVGMGAGAGARLALLDASGAPQALCPPPSSDLSAVEALHRSWCPPDALAFYTSDHVAIGKTKFGKQIASLIGKADALTSMMDLLEDDVKRHLGGLTRTTGFVSMSGERLQAITTAKPYSRATILEKEKAKLERREARGQEYFVLKNPAAMLPAFWFVTDRLVLQGQPSAIEAAIARGPGPGLPAALAEGWDAKAHVSAACRVPPEVALGILVAPLPKDSPPMYADLQSALTGVVRVGVTIGFDPGPRVKLSFTHASELGVDKAPAGWGRALIRVRDMLAALPRKIDPTSDWARTHRFLKHLEPALAKTRPARDGKTVSMAVEWKGDDLAETYFADLLDLVLEVAQNVRAAAARSLASNHLKQIGLALHSAADVNRKLPQSAAFRTKDGKPLLSWRVAILPYIEQDILYKQFKLDEPWDSPHNIKLLERMPEPYAHPQAKDKPGHTRFLGLVGKGAGFEPGLDLRLTDFTDGTSNTLLVAEAAEAVPWTKPVDLRYTAGKPLPKIGGVFKGVALGLMADGSVRTLPSDIKAKALRALITRGGGEVIED